MADLVLAGGTVVDATGERRVDVAVADGRIVALGEGLEAPTVLDCGGCVIASGLVDLAADLGEPGHEEAETVESAARAAALGGYTAIVASPASTPCIDDAAVVRDIQALAAGAAVEVQCAAAITIGRAGEQLSPMAELAALGVRLFTDAPGCVQDDRLMRRALEYASDLGVTLAQRAESASLAAGGHMHEGELSARLGVPGIPAEAEELMVMRDMALVRLTGGRLHYRHLSAAGSVAIVRAARAGGLAVTASVTPHHLSLADADVEPYDPATKVVPPLRSDADRSALRAGLIDGVIDAIATDHTPLEAHRKEVPFDEAPPGVIGLETALAVVLTHLDLPIARVLSAMSWAPAAIAGIDDRHGGPVTVGRPANLCVIDPTATWVVEGAAMASRSANTAFEGATLHGRVRHTISRGEPVVIDGEAQR
ncbi:MAG: dihydroorotase [Acidimicrobiales bacterium]